MRVKHDSSACGEFHGKQGGTADNDSVPFGGTDFFYAFLKAAGYLRLLTRRLNNKQKGDTKPWI